MSTKYKSPEGDWVCTEPKCANVNFARRNTCNRCGKERSGSGSAAAANEKKRQLGMEIGKAAAEKSHGLFSADDWQCSKCGNVNWARRPTCNMCNAPRFGDLEERTGYGGGFNEREGVEYIQRDESDDEFDEFGRKKKKFRTKNRSGDRKEPQPPRVVDDDDDDEEEDDGDLSKYDIWGDDDDDDTKDDKSKNGKDLDDSPRKSRNSSRSRSRSRHWSRSKSRSRSHSPGRRSSRSNSRSYSRSSRSSNSRSRSSRSSSRSWSRSRRRRSNSASRSPSSRRRRYRSR